MCHKHQRHSKVLQTYTWQNHQLIKSTVRMCLIQWHVPRGLSFVSHVNSRVGLCGNEKTCIWLRSTTTSLQQIIIIHSVTDTHSAMYRLALHYHTVNHYRTIYFFSLPFFSMALFYRSKVHLHQHYKYWTITLASCIIRTRKPSCRWQTRATRKHAKTCSNSTCLQRCRWQYWPIFVRLAVLASKIYEMLRNLQKIQTYRVQGHPRSLILVSMESPYVTSY